MKLENIKLNLDTELVLNVGDPIGKTNAPRCYNKLFERLHMNAIMLPCEIKKGELPKLLDACRLMGIHYLCPTMPHKSDFVDLLDDVDETSKLFHSVNAGYFEARSLGYITQPGNALLEWLRLPGDLILIVGGVVPFCWIAWTALRNFRSGETVDELPEHPLYQSVAADVETTAKG